MFNKLVGRLVALLCALSAFAQEADTTMWITNGEVNSLVRSGNTVYLGGRFTGVGPFTGSGVVLNAGNGRIAPGSAPKMTGGIATVVPDEKGGWYVGGTFTLPGRPERVGLVHLLPGGQVDAAWEIKVFGKEGAVSTLALAGNILYVGGYFTTFSGQDRNHLVALDTRTNQLTDWKPESDSWVNSLVLSGNTVYLGGNFKFVNRQWRTYLAAVDAATGAVRAWDPAANGMVEELATAGSTVYALGYFNYVGGQGRNRLAALDTITGKADAWSPASSGTVLTMTLAGNKLYLGGNFSVIEGQNRQRVAAFDATTRQLTPWSPKLDGTVTTIAASGDVVLLSEVFEPGNILGRESITALDATHGNATLWRTDVDREVSALSVAGSTVFAGGRFTSVGVQSRNGLAAVNAVTGVATGWDPKPVKATVSAIRAIAVAEGKVYVSGNFESIGGKPRRYLACLDAITGEATDWAPDPSGSVYAMAVEGKTLYLGGDFFRISGQYRTRLAAYDLTTNQLTPWSAGVEAERTSVFVTALAVSRGIVYAGGQFTLANGQARSNLAAFDAITGQVTSWRPGPFSTGAVFALGVGGNTVYAGGNFQLTGPKPRLHAAAFHEGTGEVTDWNPAVDDGVTALAVSGSLVYLGGNFKQVNGQPISALAAVDAISGTPTPWNPQVITVQIFPGLVHAVSLYNGTLYAGGDFRFIQGEYRSFFVAFHPRSAPGNTIKGTVYEDDNADCVKSAGEKGIARRVVVAQPGNYFSSTDSLGNYTIRVDTGSYTVTQVLPVDQVDYTRVVCPAAPALHVVRFTRYDSTVAGKNFANQITLRSHLAISVASDRRRRCFTGNTTVTYCNEGTAAAQNVQVHVQLPEHVALVGAGRPYAKDREGNYVFSVGALAAGTCGTINIVDSVVCNNPNIRGLTQCTRAWITPPNDRVPDPQWDRSDITLKARCGNNGRVRLGIYNTGPGNMADSSAYRIYLDAQLAFTRNFKLAPGDSLVLQVPANGRTVRLEADQRPAHPGKRQSNITSEGCGTSSGGTVSKGYVGQLPQDDEEPEVAVECLPIIDSFDPNDKAVSPAGVTDRHYTPTGRALDYVVRFQNTGTDVAYQVVVVDTLSEHLDISTLRVGAVSHPYRLHVSGKGRPILTFTFKNINLPDSTADEPRSHGRIQFSIRPKAGLPEKTRVENFADIFFDYNEPVRTNTTVNTLYDLPPVVVADVALAPSDVCPAANPVAHAGADRTLCEQDTVKLAAGQPLEGNGRWQLVRGAGTFREPNRPDATVTALAYGENVFQWRVPAGRCGSDSLAASVVITRLQKPVAVITQSGADQLVCSVAGSRYEWFLDGAKLDKQGQRIQATRSGRYTVRVEMPDGCHPDLSEAYAYAVTGLVPGATAAVRVFPNPTTGRLVVSLPVSPGGPVHVTVVDKIGRTVLSQTFNPAGNASEFRVALDLSAQATGLYVLKLQTAKGLIVRSVFKK